MTSPIITENFFQRHGAKIAFAGPNDCWLWTGAKGSHLYGMVRACMTARLAHREAYEAVNGAGSAAGLVVRHRCDVRACVNPAHLQIGTHSDNVRDKVERGRHPTKLTEADVRTIRSEYVPRSKDFNLHVLASRFGVDQSLIALVVKRKIWRHV